MDKTIGLKLEEFKKAVLSLREVVDKEKSDIIRDSVIKRFEYCFELCWKTAKVLLSDKFGIEAFSPKECFRQLRKNDLLEDEETEMLLEMADDRNEVIHTYNADFSDELYDRILDRYYNLLDGVYIVFEKENKKSKT